MAVIKGLGASFKINQWVVLARMYSSSTHDRNPHHPSHHHVRRPTPHRHVPVHNNVTITQHDVIDDVTETSPRPLVLLFGWLFAKPSYLKKYSDFYVDHGFDVMTVRVTVGQLLRPQTVGGVMSRVLELCHEGSRRQQPLLCHAFSVGGYMYGELLTSLYSSMHEYPDFQQRMFGKIFDSPIDYYGVPRGVARAVTTNQDRIARIESTVKWYMLKFERVTQQYIRASDNVHENALKTPALILYSHNDPLCNPDHIETVAHNWRRNGIHADTVSWERAPHVTSFKMYPDEYKAHVIDFIWRTGIPGHRMSLTERSSPLKSEEREQMTLKLAYC